ncbi:MAG TPA: maleylpyruvate isomerase N-terminal domain-containing protein [Egibacteraceae bacterium]|nr:maleylpyruvate isomerase N-terminal domain-containing protein [Egibacteraceae bacterium]
MRKTAAVAALRAQRVATVRRLAGLPDGIWHTPCLPHWRVGDVAAHLVAVDEAFATGKIHQALRRAGDLWEFDHGDDATRWDDREPAELLQELERWGKRLATVADRLPTVVGRLPMPGWLGRQPLLFFAYRRVLDEWVHECDVAWATDSTSRQEPVAVEDAVGDVLALSVLSVLPHVGLPRARRTSGVARVVVDTGGGRRLTWGIDFARRQYGPRVTARPDAVVRTDARTLALVAEQRWAWQGVDAEHLTVDGDEAVATDVLDLLASAP